MANVEPAQKNNAGYDIAAPDPAALIESLRAFGYTTEAAVADLIDNSLTARCRNVWIDWHWDGRSSRIAIRDDGRGMDEAALLTAMRPGSQSPLDDRSKDDLGRFGLGLKTASFSQARRLTVASRPKGGVTSVRCWDLDEVEATHEWRLLKTGSDEALTAARALTRSAGTVVVWEDLDRILGTEDHDDEEAVHRRFLELAKRVQQHVAVTFHRFMVGRGAVKFHMNGRQIPPWDPFLGATPFVQVLEAEAMPYRGELITIQPYVLPHRSKLSTEDFDRAGLHGRWNDLQGFYVYRNRRLLVAGDYLGLGFQKEEHYKLARIAVDISNGLDSEWQIDVRKSQARPPNVLRDTLKRVATVTRTRAAEVYRHRGRVLTNRAAQGLTPAWEQKLRHGKITYAVNREHPAVEAALASKGVATRKHVKALLSLLEETVPIPLISINAAERPEEQAAPFEGADRQLRSVADELFQALMRAGMTTSAARRRLATIEPFHLYPDLIATIEYDFSGGDE